MFTLDKLLNKISEFFSRNIKYIPYMLIGIWIIYPFFILFILSIIKLNGWHSFIPIQYDSLGLFGDLFGGLNALFSGGALAGIIYSIYLQNIELKLQRKEMQKQRDEFVENRKVMQQHKFENYFFQELFRLREVRKSIFIKGGHKYEFPIPNQSDGCDLFQERDCWGDFAIMILHKHCNKLSYKVKQDKKNNDKTKFDFFYDNLFYQFLGGYFRVIYNIVKYIDNLTELTEEQKIKYVHILRAELSNSELYFLIQTGLSRYGEKFKPLLEKYSMLEHFNNDHETEDKISITYLIQYDDKAFGENENLIKQCNTHKEKVEKNPNRRR